MPTVALKELADLARAQLRGDGELPVRGAAGLMAVRDGEITLVESSEHLDRLAASPAAAAVVPQPWPELSRPALVVDDVQAAFTRIVGFFRPARPRVRAGVSPQAYVDTTAVVGHDVEVHAGATISADVVVGDGCTLYPGVHLMPGCRLGKHVTIFSNAVLYEGTVVGDRSVIHAGVVLGGYGFGYSLKEGRHMRGAQLGHVEIGSEVEIGAGTTIDRGTYDATVIGDGTKIDNQVMIGHNCRIGRHNLLCSQVGIAGSCVTGDYVVMGGQVGVSDHITVGDRAKVGAKGGVMADIPDDDVQVGLPCMPERQYWRMWSQVRRLPEIVKQLRQQERRRGAA